jgi:single-strand DNA-binding protein
MNYLPSQMAVVEFGIAVNRRWRGPDGQQREETCFVDCRAYGKQAETINQHLAKGRSVLVEGRLQYDTWEGKDGTKRSKHRVVIERFQFLGSPAGRPTPPPPQAPVPQAGDESESAEPAPPSEEAGGSDIPF